MQLVGWRVEEWWGPSVTDRGRLDREFNPDAGGEMDLQRGQRAQNNVQDINNTYITINNQ